jgi:hypothetical protein
LAVGVSGWPRLYDPGVEIAPQVAQHQLRLHVPEETHHRPGVCRCAGRMAAAGLTAMAPRSCAVSPPPRVHPIARALDVPRGILCDGGQRTCGEQATRRRIYFENARQDLALPCRSGGPCQAGNHGA